MLVLLLIPIVAVVGHVVTFVVVDALYYIVDFVYGLGCPLYSF